MEVKIKKSTKQWRKTILEEKICCSCYIVSNVAKKGHFCTFRLEYLEIVTYRKNLDNGFVFRTLKYFLQTYPGLWVKKKFIFVGLCYWNFHFFV